MFTVVGLRRDSVVVAFHLLTWVQALRSSWCLTIGPKNRCTLSSSALSKACNDRHCFSTHIPLICHGSSTRTVAIHRCMYNLIVTVVSTHSVYSAAYVEYPCFGLPFSLANSMCNFLSRAPLSTNTIPENDSNLVISEGCG